MEFSHTEQSQKWDVKQSVLGTIGITIFWLFYIWSLVFKINVFAQVIGSPRWHCGKESTYNAGDADSILVWEDPLQRRRCNQSILKEISPGCSLEGLMLKLIFWPPDAKSLLI